MERMEQKITRIALPERRSELIMWLTALMDEEYQMREWVQKWLKEGSNRGFANGMSGAFDMIFEEMAVDEKNLKREYDLIGLFLKDKQEAEILYKLAKVFLKLYFHCRTNEEYLASPYLPRLRKASKEAFDIFMANEKDNKEFLEFVDRVKKNQKRTW